MSATLSFPSHQTPTFFQVSSSYLHQNHQSTQPQPPTNPTMPSLLATTLTLATLLLPATTTPLQPRQVKYVRPPPQSPLPTPSNPPTVRLLHRRCLLPRLRPHQRTHPPRLVHQPSRLPSLLPRRRNLPHSQRGAPRSPLRRLRLQCRSASGSGSGSTSTTTSTSTSTSISTATSTSTSASAWVSGPALASAGREIWNRSGLSRVVGVGTRQRTGHAAADAAGLVHEADGGDCLYSRGWGEGSGD